MSAEPYWMTKEQINISLAKRAWSHYYIPYPYRNSYTCFKPLFELCADDVVWLHEGPDDPRVPTYPGEIRGKQAVQEAFETEVDKGLADWVDLEDPVGTPQKFVAAGDRVVMLLEERYRVIKTNAAVRHNHAAIVMDFRDGKIIRMRAIANLSTYIEAFIGVGWSTRRD